MKTYTEFNNTIKAPNMHQTIVGDITHVQFFLKGEFFVGEAVDIRSVIKNDEKNSITQTPNVSKGIVLGFFRKQLPIHLLIANHDGVGTTEVLGQSEILMFSEFYWWDEILNDAEGFSLGFDRYLNVAWNEELANKLEKEIAQCDDLHLIEYNVMEYLGVSKTLHNYAKTHNRSNLEWPEETHIKQPTSFKRPPAKKQDLEIGEVKTSAQVLSEKFESTT